MNCKRTSIQRVVSSIATHLSMSKSKKGIPHPGRRVMSTSWIAGPNRGRRTRTSTRTKHDTSRHIPLVFIVVALAFASFASRTEATPANKAALVKYYGKFLATNLNNCTTCHLPAKLEHPPESLDEFPHNSFGNRLRELGKELSRQGKNKDIGSRLALIAREDTDNDGVPNEAELLVGHASGDARDKPARKELASLRQRQAAFARFLSAYRWEPFQSVKAPPLPKLNRSKGWARNPIDSFIAAEHTARGLKPRPEAPKSILLRRIYLDMIGLTPTITEQRDFEADHSVGAYEKVVDRLLDDPRYGERWGRHWMDVWRYSDWAGWSGGNQIRDSKPHIWRWRDWIVESLNGDKGYDRMVLEMLAADELAPEDTNMVRATGFLARNYKMLSREQWLEDTVKHTSQAFLGVTVGCAKCHNHMFDPISQKDYFQMRAIFEPHQVRTDRVPGQLDLLKDGLVRVFDTNTNAPTYLFVRGDERRPDTNQLMRPGVPIALAGRTSIAGSNGKLEPRTITLPRLIGHPDKRDFVKRDTVAAAEREVIGARTKYGDARAETNSSSAKLSELRSVLAVAEARLGAIRAVLRAESLEDDGKRGSEEWKTAARAALKAQRQQAMAEAEQNVLLAKNAEAAAQSKVASKPETDDKQKKENEKAARDLEAAKKKTTEAEKALADARKNIEAELTASYKARSMDDYPETSTGRRLAFAQWLTSPENPLTARVAINHIWLRHFGQGIVPTPHDFGASGRPPSHPAALDWLAAEFMTNKWSMKKLHRLILTSSTYRMLSTGDEANAKIDPDNLYLWRMPSRRMEAELVRDNLLYLAGTLDSTMGGPDVDHALGLSSKRRSIYLRTAAEKEVEFLRIFDNASVMECYMRKPSVMPQQALAMANSEIALNQASMVSAKLLEQTGRDCNRFIAQAFQHILARPPKADEARFCRDFLIGKSKQLAVREEKLIPVSSAPVASDPSAPDKIRARDLVLVLFNHNDFVTIR